MVRHLPSQENEETSESFSVGAVGSMKSPYFRPTGLTKEGRWVTAGDAENLLQGRAAGKSARPTHARPPQATLRAGDPEATAGAAVLANDEFVVVPPEPVHRQSGIVPFQTDEAQTRRASGDPHSNCLVEFSRKMALQSLISWHAAASEASDDFSETSK